MIFGLCGLATLAILYLAYYLRLETLRATGLYLLLLSAELLAVCQLLELRLDLARAAENMADETPPPDAEDEPDTDEENTKGAEDSPGEPAVENSEESARAEMLDFGSGYLLYFTAGFSLMTVFLAGYSFLKPLGQSAVSGKIALALAFAFLVPALAAVIASRYYETVESRELPEARGLELWFRGAFWLSIIMAFSQVLRSFNYIAANRIIAQVMLVVVFVVSIELFISACRVFFARKELKSESDIKVYTNPFTLRMLFSEINPVRSIFSALETAFGVNLRSTWALSFVKQSLVPLVCLLLLVSWAFTALVMVGTTERGILERFGRPVSHAPLESGLHITMPWPIDRVRRVDVTRMRSMPIGFTEAKKNASLLWTKAHAVEEYNLMIGDGRDLVTVNAEINYTIKDVYNFLYSSQNPESSLEVISYRVLMMETVGKPLDQVLSENIEKLVGRMKTEIQREVDEKQLGIEVADLVIKGLHPPIAVAPDYQAVVSAQVDRKTSMIRGNAYRMETIPKAEAEALWTVNNSLANKATRLAEARGQAIQFRTVEESYRASPELFRLRLRHEGLEKALKLKRVFILDDRIEGDGAKLWIDARPQKNPPDF